MQLYIEASLMLTKITLEKAHHSWAKHWASKQLIKFYQTPPTVFHQYLYWNATEMASAFETACTRTLRYTHPSREIYIKEPITSRNAVGAPPDPGWQHQHHRGVVSSGGAPTSAGTSVFTKHNWDVGMGHLGLNGRHWQPIQAGTLNNIVHTQYK